MEIIGGIVVLFFMVLLSGLKIVKEHSQLVVYRLGKISYARGPGIHLILPVFDHAEIVDTRIITISTPVIEETSKDQVSIKISALILVSIVDAKRTLSKIQSVQEAVNELLQASLRSLVRQNLMKDLVSDPVRMTNNLKSSLDKQVRDWGLKIAFVEIKELKVPREMKKAILRAKYLKQE